MVVSEKLYSPQNYLELMTGNYYPLSASDNDILFIEDILKTKFGKKKYNSYYLSDIELIIENNASVVLVECMIWHPKEEEYAKEYRWFEVIPERFSEVE